MKISKEIIDKLKEFSTPELCDAVERKINLDHDIKQLVGNKKIVGRAYTVDVPPNESLIVANALKNLTEGDVLVISGKGKIDSSYWGDYRSICAKFKKAEAVVIDGAIRDIEDCEEIGFPIFAKSICPKASNKEGTGKINIKVICGGIEIEPGDIIFGDRNGVICLKDSDVESAMEKAEEKRKNEEYTISKMFETGQVLPKILKRPKED